MDIIGRLIEFSRTLNPYETREDITAEVLASDPKEIISGLQAVAGDPDQDEETRKEAAAILQVLA